VLALRVYGRYVPRAEEREKWEKIAAAQDEAARQAAGQSGSQNGSQ
jgi:hypothetical protein